MKNIFSFFFRLADEEAEKKELLGVNTGTVSKPAKPNPFVKIFFHIFFFFRSINVYLVYLAPGNSLVHPRRIFSCIKIFTYRKQELLDEFMKESFFFLET